MMETKALEDAHGVGVHDVTVARLLTPGGVTPVVILRTHDFSNDQTIEQIMEKEVVADLIAHLMIAHDEISRG